MGSTIDGVSTAHTPVRKTGQLVEGVVGLRGAFIARVTRVDVANGTHVVWCASKLHGREFPARVLMPFVSPDGLGFLAGIRKNTRCLVVSSSLEAEPFVVGFFSDDPAGAYAGPAVHQGDLHLASSGGAVISALASGDINLHSHDLCGVSLFRDDQRITAVDRTFEHKHAGGREQWGEATEDGSDHSAGDTWRSVEVRRERGKPTTIKHVTGHVPNPGINEPEIVSRRQITDESGNDLLLEEIETNGTITITHPNGARFRLEAGGDVFVEPKSGGGIYMNDPNKVAKGSARIGDIIETHGHTVAITRAGPFVATVEVAPHVDIKIEGGSSVVKVG